jgi:hypothetical protein
MESRRPPNQADVWKDYEIFDVEAKKEELTEDVYAGILDDYGIKSPDYGDEATFCVACSLLRSHGLQVEVAVGKPTLITVYHPQIREIEGEPYESPHEMYGVSMSDFL